MFSIYGITEIYYLRASKSECMAKLLPVFLLAVFLIIFIASYLPERTGRSAAAIIDKQDSVQHMQVKKYWMVFLKKGAAKQQDAVTEALVQEKHMSHIRRLADAGKLLVAGPFGDSGTLRGIYIMDCKDSLEVVSLIEPDTAIVTGRLKYEIKPWWTVENCLFK